MQSIAFAAPYVPGKLEKDREAMRSVSEGDRKAAHDASRKRHGISREAVWLQQTPEGDMAIVYLEAEDLAAAFREPGRVARSVRPVVPRRRTIVSPN